MIRYPHTLEIWHEDDAVLNPDGSWTEGAHEWRFVGRCNARQNGQAQEVRGTNGKAFLYSYEVVMPPCTPPIPIGTVVRIIDRKGVNIFNHQPADNSRPDIKAYSAYPIQGFYASGQRYECTKLWL